MKSSLLVHCICIPGKDKGVKKGSVVLFKFKLVTEKFPVEQNIIRMHEMMDDMLYFVGLALIIVTFYTNNIA